jgi:hypothetical protein
MPQNWWELFPEVVPSPAARPRPLPGPGGAIPRAAIADQLYVRPGASDPAEGSSGVFDPSFFSGDAAADDWFSGGGTDQALVLGGARPNRFGVGEHGSDPSGAFADLVPGASTGKGGDAQHPYQAKGVVQPTDHAGEFGRAIVNDVDQFVTDPKRSSDPRVRLRLANEMALNSPIV